MNVQQTVLSVGIESSLPTWTLTGAGADDLVARADDNGVLALLGVAIDEGIIDVPGEVRRLVSERWLDRLLAAVKLDACLVEITEAMRRSGVPSRVLKGCASAHLDELSPSWRTYGDVDLLVPSDRLIDTVRAMAALDFHPVVEPVRVSWTARFGKSVTLVRADGTELDLHRMLAAGPFGSRVSEEALFATGEPFAVGGAPLTALHVAHRFLHSCYHATLGGVRLWRHARDVALLTRRVRPKDLEDKWSEGWSETVVATALAWASETLPGASTADWAHWRAERTTNARDARLVASYNSTFAAVARAQFAELDSMSDRARFAAGLLVPSRPHLRDRGESRFQRLRRIAAEAHAR